MWTVRWTDDEEWNFVFVLPLIYHFQSIITYLRLTCVIVPLLQESCDLAHPLPKLKCRFTATFKTIRNREYLLTNLKDCWYCIYCFFPWFEWKTGIFIKHLEVGECRRMAPNVLFCHQPSFRWFDNAKIFRKRQLYLRILLPGMFFAPYENVPCFV